MLTVQSSLAHIYKKHQVLFFFFSAEVSLEISVYGIYDSGRSGGIVSENRHIRAKNLIPSPFCYWSVAKGCG